MEFLWDSEHRCSKVEGAWDIDHFAHSASITAEEPET